MKMKKILTVLTILLFASLQEMAQDRNVTGTVTDKSDSKPIPGVIVRVKDGTANGITDGNGNFSISTPSSATTLIFSYIGYVSQEVAITDGNISVALEASGQLGEVVISVGRGVGRTNTSSAVPVDNITNKDLASTGQFTFDKALQYRVPSFNTVNTPVNDASTLLDPYEIRNLGPSRLLVLINGKRKNLSSLLYVQFAPGRGETGADLSGIPTDAIKRVEILRDGASAQYGSDAIAGVMNVILKDKFEYTTLNVNTGVTGKGDGASYGVSLNTGGNIGSNGGFANFTFGVNQQENAIRSGIIDRPTEKAIFGGTPADNALIDKFLDFNPTGGNLNGTGATSKANFLTNFELPVGETSSFYGNAAYVFKKVMSNANYRTPYWAKDYGLLHTPVAGGINYTDDDTTLSSIGTPLYNGYVGYMPTFEGDLKDYNATLGFKNETNGWKQDASITIGGNKQVYTVNNTVNHTLGANGPTSFKPGGYDFHHVVGNLDISKEIVKTFNIGLGTEVRNETFQIIAGDTSSFSGSGSNSFPGIRAENARTDSRYNFGAYLDASWDITKNFLINATGRTEKYSDFGSASVAKISSRYKFFSDKLVLRASYSSGFRAPTLHQIYAQSTQASFAGGTIVNSGLFNNGSKEAYLLGIPKLKAEKSTNITVGLGVNLNSKISITLDYYDVTIKDRIVYSSSISTNDTLTDLYKILQTANLASIQFFINGIQTRTQGLDFVASIKNLNLGKGRFGINLAGNYNIANDIIGAPNDPKAIKDAGASILSTQIKSLLTESRPKFKAIFGLDYSVGNFNVVLNNTVFGPTKFQDLDNGGSQMNNIKQVFSTAAVTDLNIGYAFTKNFSASFTVNNIFNVLPKWKLELTGNPSDPDYAAAKATLEDPTEKSLLEGLLGFSGRYRTLGYNGSQFSQLGTTFMAQITYKF